MESLEDRKALVSEIKKKRSKKAIEKRDVSSTEQILRSGYDFVQSIRNGNKQQFDTGYPTLNYHMLGGIFFKTNLVIGGGSGVGKSTFATDLLINYYKFNPDLKLKTNYWNFEMPDFLQGLRLLTRFTGRTMRSMFTEGLDNSFDELMKAAKDLDIEFHNTPANVDYILEMNERMIKEYPDHMLINFVDHTRLVMDDDNENQMMKDLMMGLNALRKKANVTNIILSQFSKENQKINKRGAGYIKPSTSDLFGNQLVENFADYIMLLHRPEKFYTDGYILEDGIKYDVKDVIFLELEKNRAEKTGTFLFKADFSRHHFEELSELEIIG